MLPKITIAALLSSGVVSALPHTETRAPKSKSLKWGACDEEFTSALDYEPDYPIECATLQVPLDYTSKNSKSLDLDLLRVKANHTSSDRRSILMNPGGPGSSGLEYVATGASEILKATGGQFDIIGFDPRGTGRTIPFDCPDLDDATEYENSTHSRRSEFRVNVPQRNLYDTVDSLWDYSNLIAEGCKKSHPDTGRFIGTAFVARDMIQIVDALDEDGLLRFWGTSYGTMIGQTAAAMFPDRIDRMLLEAVVVPWHHYAGSWAATTRDTDKGVSNALRSCLEAGPKHCPLAKYAGSNATLQQLEAAFADGLQVLKDKRIKLPKSLATTEPHPGPDDLFERVKSDLLDTLYSPFQIISTVNIAGFVIRRDWNGLIDLLAPKDTADDDDDEEDVEPWNKGYYAVYGIDCSDSSFRADSVEELDIFLRASETQGMFSDTYGLYGSSWVCSAWKFKAAERFEGKFENIKTKNPLLFANGRYDPVTSLSGALEAATAFKGSGFLESNGQGHGVTSHTSKCVFNAIREYFEDATLPKPGTVCQPDVNGYLLSKQYS